MLNTALAYGTCLLSIIIGAVVVIIISFLLHKDIVED